jgi:hypothetical protein
MTISYYDTVSGGGHHGEDTSNILHYNTVFQAGGINIHPIQTSLYKAAPPDWN